MKQEPSARPPSRDDAGIDQYFREIFDGLPAMVTLMTPSGELELANSHVLTFFEKSLQELKDYQEGRSFHPDDFPGVMAAWQHSMSTGETYDHEARQLRADGEYRWMHICGFPLHDSNGVISHWSFLQTDVDDARRAEALLAAENKLLGMVARGRAMADVLETICTLAEGAIRECSCSIFLVDQSATYLELGVGPNLPAAFVSSINGRPLNAESGPCAMAAHHNQQVIAADLRVEERWLTYSWPAMAMKHGVMSCWSTPFSSSQGSVLGAFAIYRDVPSEPTRSQLDVIDRFAHIASIAVERTRDREALARSEALLNEAQHLSRTGSFSWRSSTERIVFSDQTYSTYEFPLEEPVTIKLIEARTHPDDRALLREIVAKARIDGGDLDYDMRLLMPDGSTKHLHLVAHWQQTDDGEREYIGAIQDVTERKRSDEALDSVRNELAHVNRVSTLGALTASIAHEVSQPISGIITNASTCLSMLTGNPPNVDGAIETARRTIRDGNRASDVITRLRALFAKKAVAAEPVDLNDAAREVLTLSSADMRRQGVAVEVHFAADLGTVTGDRVQLQQIILNLLLNGSEAMREVTGRPRELVVETANERSGNVRLTVTDSGVGINPAATEPLFAPFYTTKGSGMGMGLSISRSIIETHHGRIWATANGDHGAAFSFSLPCRSEKAGKITKLHAVGIQ